MLQRFKSQRILILGDAMLDVYLNGSSTKICREAPVPIVSVSEKVESAGGAANTASNIAALGATSYFLSVVGHDQEGDALVRVLHQHNVQTNYLIRDITQKTITKQRVSAETHLLVRFDTGAINLPRASEDNLLSSLEELYPQMDAIIVSDYDYGIITDRVIDTLYSLQKKYHKILSIDSKRLNKFAHLSPTLVKPNYKEALALLGLDAKQLDKERLEQISKYGKALRTITKSAIAAITLDTLGSLTFADNLSPIRTYTTPQKNSHAAGAGDTFISAFTLALSANIPLPTSAEIAALATSIVVEKDGTTLCTLSELLERLNENRKVVPERNELTDLVTRLKHEGKSIIFTNGCFDILHRGHVTYLEEAKKRGDILILGINSDESVKRLKGPARPINTLEDRITVLSALGCIDYVVPFNEDTPVRLIQLIQPDTYVKGGDYTRETLPETPIVEQYGGTVEIIPFVMDRSTTGIIHKITQTYKDAKKEKFVQAR